LKSRRGKQHNPNFRRKDPFRDPKRLIFILCEGKETEPNYFKAIREKKRRCNAKIEIPKNVNGTNPKRLLQYGKELKKDGPNDIVWCVFDHDERPEIKETMQQMQNAGLKVALSNPCIELWFLLHFTDAIPYLTSAQAISELGKQINNYDKSMQGIYDMLKPHLNEAMFNAKILRKKNLENHNDEMANPSTNVDYLIEFLESL